MAAADGFRVTKDFPEADWRKFRDLRVKALDKYCQLVLGEIAAIGATTDLSPHARYLKTFDLVQERNEEMARIFDDPRRSRALMQVALMYRSGLVSSDDLAQFSEETRSRLKSLANF